MNHPLNVSSLIVGGMLMMSSAVAYLFQRTRPNEVRGLSYKQFVWCCGIGFISGAFVALGQFIFPE